MVHGCLFMGLARWSFTVFFIIPAKKYPEPLIYQAEHSALKYHPITIFTKTALLGTALELVIGWLLNTFFHLRYWDYSSYPYNFHGYICLFSAIGFGIAGMLWICVFSNIFRKYWFSLPPGFRRCFNSMLVLLFLTDCAAALIFPNAGHGITF